MAHITKVYQLNPVDCRKSFYGKALVKVYDDGTQVLQSYDTDVMKRTPGGTFTRFVAYAKPTLTRWNMWRVDYWKDTCIGNC